MSGYILRENDPGIVLTADQVDRLVKNGDGDAALLYVHRICTNMNQNYWESLANWEPHGKAVALLQSLKIMERNCLYK